MPALTIHVEPTATGRWIVRRANEPNGWPNMTAPPTLSASPANSLTSKVRRPSSCTTATRAFTACISKARPRPHATGRSSVTRGRVRVVVRAPDRRATANALHSRLRTSSPPPPCPPPPLPPSPPPPLPPFPPFVFFSSPLLPFLLSS